MKVARYANLLEDTSIQCYGKDREGYCPNKEEKLLTISIAILKAAQRDKKKTHLLTSVSMNWDQFSRYIRFLENHRFIEEFDNEYKTTNEGLELIKGFDSSLLLQSML